MYNPYIVYTVPLKSNFNLASTLFSFYQFKSNVHYYLYCPFQEEKYEYTINLGLKSPYLNICVEYDDAKVILVAEVREDFLHCLLQLFQLATSHGAAVVQHKDNVLPQPGRVCRREEMYKVSLVHLNTTYTNNNTRHVRRK